MPVTIPAAEPTAGTLDAPAVGRDDYYGAWTVDAGYYGRAESAGPAWVVEKVVPNTEAAARELLAVHPLVTAGLAGREAPRHHGLAAAVFPYHPRRFRLRAERTPAGWRVVEYDYAAWEFLVPTPEPRPPAGS